MWCEPSCTGLIVNAKMNISCDEDVDVTLSSWLMKSTESFLIRAAPPPPPRPRAILSVTFSQSCAICPFVWVQIKLFSSRTKRPLCHWGFLPWQSITAHSLRKKTKKHEEIIILSGPCYFSKKGVPLSRPWKHCMMLCIKRLALVNGPINSSCTVSKLKKDREKKLFYSPFVRHAFHLLCSVSVFKTTFL